MTGTAGEARAKLLARKQAGRGRSHDRVMKQFRSGGDMTETDIALAAYDDGWKDGYAAGFQQALSSVQDALATTIAAQRGGIMAKSD